ncbi:hypothetical protein KFL_005600050 [Klebsormidium nitens]|uniref:Uncharacterized protein n=1 Tax=Klebsormidium nitens TaxID=105231 RepID=A0A1Y1IK32_KLENI|nr:hypothetical protein KFL_005600050 [Klebsormidium nitens]|eukprot:GAQ89769.1 hypothetical protein KFL_005600050 [Klebsormidium nitens]
MVVLDRAAVEAADVDGQPWGGALKLALPNRGLSDVGVLGQCHLLQRLDLAHNSIASVQALSSCAALRWLNLTHNSLTSLDGLQSLTSLNVLNVSHNTLSSLDAVTSLHSLNALIASDNELSSLPSLAHLSRLNTLVVSSNLLPSLGTALAACSSLLKLSLSHNDVTSLKGALRGCPALQELRFAHNSAKALPSDLAALSSLRIVDAGHNAVSKWRGVALLAELPRLRQLNLMGNPLTAHPDYRTKVLELAPGVSVLDGRRVDRDYVQPQGEAQPDTGAGGMGDGGEDERTEHKGRPAGGQGDGTPQERTAERRRGYEESGKGSEASGGGAGTASNHERDTGLREGRSAKEAGGARPNGKRKRGPRGDEVEPVRLADGDPTPVSGEKAGAADKGGAKGGPARQGGEGTERRQKKRKAEGKLSAKETGVVKVVLHAEKSVGKGQGKKPARAPLLPAAQPLGAALDVGLGGGGPSSWG